MNWEELLKQYNSIKPDANWLKQSERELKSQLPGINYPAYLSGITTFIFLVFGWMVWEGSEPSFMAVKTAKLESETAALVKQVKEIKANAQKIEKNIQEVLAVKSVASDNQELDPRIKLEEDLQKVKAAREVLEEIEQDIANGDFLIARNKLDFLLKNGNMEGFPEMGLKVEDLKENETIN